MASLTSIGKIILRWYFLTWLHVVNTVFGMVLCTILAACYRILRSIGAVVLSIFAPAPSIKTSLPPIGDRFLLKESASAIAEKIRRREISSEEVVRTFIGRIHEVNPHITALVDERFEIAIDDAKKVDVYLSSCELSEGELQQKFPLLGVPFTIKDSFCVQGLKHTAGLFYRKDHVANDDADVVKTLKHSGAIPVGVTNVSELCMWWESINTVYGRSKNPYDTRHITGGSSGGEAALQGAAGSAFGIGSDIGGSIRMPAFFCGLYGHKPSSGLISNWGQIPECKGVLDEYLTVGPIVRHPCDLRVIFDTIIGENIRKVNVCPEPSRIRIFYMEDDGGSPLTSPICQEMRDAMNKSLQILERKYGVKPQKVNISKLFHSLEIWANGMSGAGAATFCEELAMKNGKVNPFWEMIKYVFRCSAHTFPALTLGIVEKIAYGLHNFPRHKEMIKMGDTLAKELQDLLRDDAIMLYPSHPNPAPRHNEPFFRPSDFSYFAIFNVLKVPVTQVPLGLSSDGLPLGVQIVGGLYSDHLTMRVADDIHEGAGGWVPPS